MPHILDASGHRAFRGAQSRNGNRQDTAHQYMSQAKVCAEYLQFEQRATVPFRPLPYIGSLS